MPYVHVSLWILTCFFQSKTRPSSSVKVNSSGYVSVVYYAWPLSNFWCHSSVSKVERSPVKVDKGKRKEIASVDRFD